MPATNPRINVVLEKPVYDSIRRLAKRDGVSMSMKVRDLVNESIEIEEDVALSAIAEEREKTYRRNKALTHDDVWK